MLILLCLLRLSEGVISHIDQTVDFCALSNQKQSVVTIMGCTKAHTVHLMVSSSDLLCVTS